MKLYIAETQVDTKWSPMFFWVGSLRLALRSGLKSECRVRRVTSLAEADQLATLVTQYGSEKGEPWNLDTFNWEWPD